MNGSLFDFFAFRMIVFADLTAFSAFPFDCGWPGLAVLCLKSHRILESFRRILRSIIRNDGLWDSPSRKMLFQFADDDL